MTAQPTTLTLSAFLAAMLDEDEAAARAATAGSWSTTPAEGNSVDILSDEGLISQGGPAEDGGGYYGALDLTDALHIARHDPARVLADVEAKRAVVALAEDARAACAGEGEWVIWHQEDKVTARADALETALRLLALPYASHEDWREEWRP